MAPLTLPRWALHSQLLLAIRKNDVDTASQVLGAGVDADTKFAINSQKRPALCLSVEKNYINMVRLLLQLGASVNQVDTCGASPLYLASSLGYTDVARLLLQEARPNVNARTSLGGTALHAATACGSLEIVVELIHEGANLTIQDKDGRTALHIAAMKGFSDISKCLIEQGAPVAVLDSLNNTPLHHAVAEGGIDIENIEVLIKKCPQALCITNKNGLTPLTIAIRGFRQDIEMLLTTILRLALIIMPKLYHTMILGNRSEFGHTPLHLAVLEKRTACVRVLLAAGAEVNSRNNLGQTPLASAARDGSRDIVELLLSAGAVTRTVTVRAGEEDRGGEAGCAEDIRAASRNPLPLSGACRRTINRHVGLSGACEGWLPAGLRRFLSYEYLSL